MTRILRAVAVVIIPLAITPRAAITSRVAAIARSHREREIREPPPDLPEREGISVVNP
jgi:hypothetical protein